MNANPYATVELPAPVGENPANTVGFSTDVSLSTSTASVSVQITGVLIVLLLAAIIVMARSWPVVG